MKKDVWFNINDARIRRNGKSVFCKAPWYAMSAKDREVDKSPISPTTQDNTESLIKKYKSMTPQDIYRGLISAVVGQNEACKDVAIMMYQHIQGHRFVSLLAGPTGSGKTFIASRLCEMFPEIVRIQDVSDITGAGWSGDKKISTLFDDIEPLICGDDAIYPVIYMDECDKLFKPEFGVKGTNYSTMVQGQFLTAIHGGTVLLDRDKNTVDTTHFSILFGGSFASQAEENAENESSSGIGFGAVKETVRAYHKPIDKDDIIKAGCMPELAGRIRKIIPMNSFDEESYKEFMKMKGRGPVYELEKEFDIKIKIKKSKLEKLAHDAYESGEGMRGIKNEIQKYIDELIWEDCTVKELKI